MVWASIAWVAAVALMFSGSTAAFIADHYGPAFALLSHGLLATGVAATLTVRVYLNEHTRMMIELSGGRSTSVRRLKP